MEGYATLMFVFAGILFLYAGLLATTQNMNLLPRSDAVKVKDKKGYAKRAASILALTALAPFFSALLARRTGSAAAALLTLVGGGAAMLWLGVKLTAKEKE